MLSMTLCMGGAAAQGAEVFVDYYTPQFYVDNLVFFTEDGEPYYYENDMAYAVPKDYTFYNELFDHYWDNVDAYIQWYDEVGYANLHYRQPVQADFYKPLYYRDYPVFFQDDGRPFYFVDGAVVLVPRHDSAYKRFARHYKQRRSEYTRWYRQRGRHFHQYRRPIQSSYYHPLYHNGYLLYFDASGLPFFYRDNRRVFVKRHDRRYAGYISHYRSKRDKYKRWYRESGKNHHGYRHNKGYRRRHRIEKVPRGSHGRIEHREKHRHKRPRTRPTLRPKREDRRDRREDRREDRHDRREDWRDDRKDRREDRHDRREDRRDDRKDRREDRHDRREDRRENRKDRVKDRREDRRENRKERVKDRREDRRENRKERVKDRREDRRENRQDRVKDRRENRQDRVKDRRENKRDRREERRDKPKVRPDRSPSSQPARVLKPSVRPKKVETKDRGKKKKRKNR